MKSANFPAIFRRLAAPFLAVAFLSVPGPLAADETPPPETMATVASSGNLMNIAVYDALLSAGAGEPQARAATKSVANTDQFVTKTDLAEAKSELKDEIAHLRNDLILLGAGTAGAIVLMMLAGFHLLWRRISELAERLPPRAAA